MEFQFLVAALLIAGGIAGVCNFRSFLDRGFYKAHGVVLGRTMRMGMRVAGALWIVGGIGILFGLW